MCVAPPPPPPKCCRIPSGRARLYDIPLDCYHTIWDRHLTRIAKNQKKAARWKTCRLYKKRKHQACQENLPLVLRRRRRRLLIIIRLLQQQLPGALVEESTTRDYPRTNNLSLRCRLLPAEKKLTAGPGTRLHATSHATCNTSSHTSSHSPATARTHFSR